MGKLNDLLKKIKGMFNRNRALPAGTTEKIITDTVPENYEKEEKIEMETSQHQNFVNELKKQSEQYDLTTMPMEDAILKALEEKGLNPEFSKNPEFQNQMTQIFSSVFYKANRAEDAVKNLRSAIMHGMQDYKFSITPDGNLEYTKRNDNSFTNPSITKYFMLSKDGKLITSTLSKRSEYNNDDHKINFCSKKQSVFDKYGIEQSAILATYTQDMNEALQPVTNNFLRTVTRNSNLVTAVETVYEEPIGINVWVNDPKRTTLDNILLYDRNHAFTEIECIGEYPNIIAGAHHSYQALNEIRKKEDERHLHSPVYKEELNYYQDLAKKYSFIPEAITDDEINYKKDLHNKYLKSVTERSSAFRKLAEERGLIEKDEMAMEQE